MATSVSGGGSRNSRREPPTMGKQLVNFITCSCESSAPRPSCLTPMSLLYILYICLYLFCVCYMYIYVFSVPLYMVYENKDDFCRPYICSSVYDTFLWLTLLFEQWIIFKNQQFIHLFLNMWTLTFYCFRLKNAICTLKNIYRVDKCKLLLT
jgi:hypothetical protein